MNNYGGNLHSSPSGILVNQIWPVLRVSKTEMLEFPVTNYLSNFEKILPGILSTFFVSQKQAIGQSLMSFPATSNKLIKHRINFDPNWAMFKHLFFHSFIFGHIFSNYIHLLNFLLIFLLFCFDRLSYSASPALSTEGGSQ